MENKLGLMETNTRVILRTTSLMGKGNKSMKMEMNFQGLSKMAKLQVLENLLSHLDKFTKATGRMIARMVMAMNRGLMAQYIKALI